MKNDVQVNFRMPEELKRRLEVAARESNRTLTAELVSRLEASFSYTDTDEEFRSIVEQIGKRQDALEEAMKRIEQTSLPKPDSTQD